MKPWYAERDHPLWGLLRLTVCVTALVVSLGLFLTFNYRNGFDIKDVTTIIGSVASLAATLGLFGYAKKLATKPENTECDDE